MAGSPESISTSLPRARYDGTTVRPLPDGKGGSTLLVGQSNYESQTPSEAVAVPSVIAIAPSGGGGGGRVTPVVAGDVGSVGPLAVADVDGDGTLDLFVGGRVARSEERRVGKEGGAGEATGCAKKRRSARERARG